MIEINRRKSKFIFRINPYSPKCIDKRLNKHNARWETYGSFDTAEEAREAILRLETPNAAKEGQGE